jgi:hypothetical protein
LRMSIQDSRYILPTRNEFCSSRGHHLLRARCTPVHYKSHHSSARAAPNVRRWTRLGTVDPRQRKEAGSERCYLYAVLSFRVGARCELSSSQYGDILNPPPGPRSHGLRPAHPVLLPGRSSVSSALRKSSAAKLRGLQPIVISRAPLFSSPERHLSAREGLPRLQPRGVGAAP